MQRPFPAYDGNEPYIFVSYAHSDSRVVFDELTIMREAGFRIWYDEGISPGSRWTDDLAGRISGASLVLLFVTPNSVGSENCRNEIDFALEQERNVLLVYLKKTELPGGMKLALSGRQAILKFEHSTVAYQQKLLSALEDQLKVSGNREAARTARSRRARRVLLVRAAAAALVLALGGVAAYLFVEDAPAPTQVAARSEPLPMLIADFNNETGQPIFDGVLEEALRIGMEGAPFVTSYPRRTAGQVLQTLTEDSVLTADAARLVAVREGVQLVLAGTVRPRGNGYELIVDALDPLSGDLQLSVSERADEPLEVLNAMADLANQLRRNLGDITVESSHLEEIFTSSSMQAVSAFATAQAYAAEWRHAEAVEHYARAIEHDEDFGRAYGGWAFSAYALGQLDLSKELWEQSLARLDRMTERERLRTLGIYYTTVSRNLAKAIESYESLVERYPADAAGLNNLAVVYVLNVQMPEAREAGRRLLDIYPSSLLYLLNYSLYSMYTADMDDAVEYANVALEKDANSYMAFLPIAMSSLLDIDHQGANAAFAQMGATGVQGLSLADLGVADMALARGDYAAVLALLPDSITADEVNGNGNHAVIKRLWLARAQLLLGKAEDARATLEAVDLESLSERNELELAEVLLKLGDVDGAIAAADRLAAKVPASSRALAYVVRGMVALEAEEAVRAIEHLNRSLDVRDNWFAHYLRGLAYLRIEENRVEAMDELQIAWDRRGEALAMFLDEIPSYQRLVDVHYWLGRAQEGLGMSAAAMENFRDFSRRRDLAADDPLVLDAGKRLGAVAAVSFRSAGRD